MQTARGHAYGHVCAHGYRIGAAERSCSAVGLGQPCSPHVPIVLVTRRGAALALLYGKPRWEGPAMFCTFATNMPRAGPLLLSTQHRACEPALSPCIRR